MSYVFYAIFYRYLLDSVGIHNIENIGNLKIWTVPIMKYSRRDDVSTSLAIHKKKYGAKVLITMKIKIWYFFFHIFKITFKPP